MKDLTTIETAALVEELQSRCEAALMVLLPRGTAKAGSRPEAATIETQVSGKPTLVLYLATVGAQESLKLCRKRKVSEDKIDEIILMRAEEESDGAVDPDDPDWGGKWSEAFAS